MLSRFMSINLLYGSYVEMYFFPILISLGRFYFKLHSTTFAFHITSQPKYQSDSIIHFLSNSFPTSILIPQIYSNKNDIKYIIYYPLIDVFMP